MGERKGISPCRRWRQWQRQYFHGFVKKKKAIWRGGFKGKLTFGMLVIDINNRLEHTEEEMNISQVCHIDRERLIHLLYMDSGQE